MIYKTLKGIMFDVRAKMYKDGFNTKQLSQELNVDKRTLEALLYNPPKEKGKLLTFVKLLNYLKEL